MLKEDIKRIGL